LVGRLTFIYVVRVGGISFFLSRLVS